MLQTTVARNPDKAAVLQGPRRLSYRELEAFAARLAAGLARYDVTRGDTVAILAPNGPEFIAAFFAAAWLGATVLPLNPAYTVQELRRFLDDKPARALVTCESLIGLARACGHLGPLMRAQANEDFGPAPPLCADEEAGGLYLYTSGSTDSFKRIRCTPSNLYYEARNFVDSTGLTARDTILCAAPLHHSYGIGNGLLDAALTGATLALEPEPDLPFLARQDRLLRLLVETQARVFLGVPFQYERLAQAEGDVAAAFAGVKWCVSSGDVLPRRVFERFRARTGQPIRSLYGSTEAGSIAMDLRPAAEVDGLALGDPLAFVRIEIRGEAGEIWVASPTLPPGGYENRPGLSATVFGEGFYNTGDLGRMEDGRLHMTGRKQSFFDVGGHKVDLGEVEEALAACEGVREAAAVGVEAPGLGGMIKAVVVADAGTRESEIIAHCRARLAAFKTPRFVEFRDALPRSPVGKIMRPELAGVEDWRITVPRLSDPPQWPRTRRVEWLAGHIAGQVAAILGLAPQAVPRATPFQSLGFDSLRTVELQQRLSAMFGRPLSLLALWSHPSIDAYATHLCDEILPPPLDDEDVVAALRRELGGQP